MLCRFLKIIRFIIYRILEKYMLYVTLVLPIYFISL